MRAEGFLAVLLVVLPAGTAAAGEVYRWTDAEGNVHFGDRPPDQDRAQKLDLRTRPGDAAAARRRLEREQRLLRAFEEERQVRARAQRQAAEAERQRRRNCEKAREVLREYREATYLYDENPDGSRRILSHEERAEAEREARAQVRHWCGEG